MLTAKEKRELLKDCLDAQRRLDLTKVKSAGVSSVESLDEFIASLNTIQKVFSAYAPSQKKAVAKNNKL